MHQQVATASTSKKQENEPLASPDRHWPFSRQQVFEPTVLDLNAVVLMSELKEIHPFQKVQRMYRPLATQRGGEAQASSARSGDGECRAIFAAAMHE
jgi:hypothetical protein